MWLNGEFHGLLSLSLGHLCGLPVPGCRSTRFSIFFFCDPLPLLSWSLEQLRINYPPRNRRPLTLEKHTIPSSPQCKKKSIGSPLLPCSFSPTSTMREKPLSSSREAVIAPADIKNLHRSYAGIFCPRCKYMQSACLFVSSLRFAPLRVIIFKLQPQCLDHSGQFSLTLTASEWNENRALWKMCRRLN